MIYFLLVLLQEREEKVVLHVADVGQGTAMLIECQKTKDESMCVVSCYSVRACAAVK